MKAEGGNLKPESEETADPDRASFAGPPLAARLPERPRSVLARNRRPARGRPAGVAEFGATVCLGALLLAGPALAQDKAGGHTGTRQSTQLYTPPEPSAGGGLRGTLVAAPPLRHVFAVPADDPKKVYKGAVDGEGKSFAFSGLPTARYDLLLVFDDEAREGFVLARDPSTLTAQDQAKIKEKLESSGPFFDTKVIHRCEGATGREGKARCVLQELRTRPVTLQDGSVRSDIQIRSFKLALLEEVGIGWQLVRTRELLRQEVAAAERKGVLPVKHVPALGGLRVIDTIKDLGQIKP